MKKWTAEPFTHNGNHRGIPIMELSCPFYPTIGIKNRQLLCEIYIMGEHLKYITKNKEK